MRGALLAALLASQVCCDPGPAAPEGKEQDPPACDDATVVTSQDEFMVGDESARVSRDVAFMRDRQGRLVLVTSGSDLGEPSWYYDQSESHVYFKLVEPPPAGGAYPFFTEDSELIITTEPDGTGLGCQKTDGGRVDHRDGQSLAVGRVERLGQGSGSPDVAAVAVQGSETGSPFGIHEQDPRLRAAPGHLDARDPQAGQCRAQQPAAAAALEVPAEPADSVEVQLAGEGEPAGRGGG